jgi:hypothetical protein
MAVFDNARRRFLFATANLGREDTSLPSGLLSPAVLWLSSTECDRCLCPSSTADGGGYFAVVPDLLAACQTATSRSRHSPTHRTPP